jgi:hypothetical protein
MNYFPTFKRSIGVEITKNMKNVPSSTAVTILDLNL